MYKESIELDSCSKFNSISIQMDLFPVTLPNAFISNYTIDTLGSSFISSISPVFASIKDYSFLLVYYDTKLVLLILIRLEAWTQN
jgi:hypothetical protein